MKFRYSIIIVTYNRLDLLKECLEHAENQTVTPTKIIVIDNCSTDGTGKYLDDNYLNNPLYIIIHTQENTGGAGGFYTGLVSAMDVKSDWFMLIDDDAILEYDCMEHMNPYNCKSKSEAYACTVVCNGEIDLEHRRNFDGAIPLKEYDTAEFRCKYATFCGLMVSHSLVKKIGYPEAEYFIWFDDTEYSMRIIEHTDIIVSSDARLNHKTMPEPKLKGHRKARWKTYYGTRNNLHALKKHKLWWQLVKAIKRDIIIIKLLRAGFSDRSCIKEVGLFCDAVKDGLKGKLGKNPKYLPGKKGNN